jgi:hypothetical protein
MLGFVSKITESFTYIVCRQCEGGWRKAGRVGLVSISLTFYEQLLCQCSWAKKLQSQTVTREKLCIIRMYEKVVHKMLIKLTPDKQCHIFFQFLKANFRIRMEKNCD